MAETVTRMVDDLPPNWEVRRIADRLRALLPEVRERYGVESVEVFGSYVRNEQRPGSDLDLLVTFSRTPTLFDLVGLTDDLTDLLSVPADVVMRSSLSPRILRWVDREAVAL